MTNRNDPWGLWAKEQKLIKARQRREAQLEIDRAEEAKQAQIAAERAAAEQAERDRRQAITDEYEAALAELGEAEAAKERDRVAKVKAAAEAPEILADLWARSDASYAELLSVKDRPAEKARVWASITMKAAVGIDVPLELWRLDPNAGYNICDLSDFLGFRWRVQRIAPEHVSALSTPDVFMLRIEGPSGWVTVPNVHVLAELAAQYPSLRPVLSKSADASVSPPRKAGDPDPEFDAWLAKQVSR